MKSVRKVIEGKRFNSWKVLEFIETVDKITFYKAECLECGGIYRVDGRNVRLGLSKRCTSCGRAKSAKSRTGKMRKGLEPTEAAYRKLYSRYKKGAKKRKIGFELGLAHFIQLTKLNCFYCGIGPSTKTNPLLGSGYSDEKLSLSSIVYNGVDRIDSNRGYRKDNVVTCCESCNVSKRDLNITEFFKWAKRLSQNINLLESAIADIVERTKP